MKPTQTKHRMLAFAIGAFWGTLGMHQFYLNRNANGFGYIGFGMIGWFFIFFGLGAGYADIVAIGLLVLPVLVMVLIIDLARILIMDDETFDDMYN